MTKWEGCQRTIRVKNRLSNKSTGTTVRNTLTITWTGAFNTRIEYLPKHTVSKVISLPVTIVIYTKYFKKTRGPGGKVRPLVSPIYWKKRFFKVFIPYYFFAETNLHYNYTKNSLNTQNR